MRMIAAGPALLVLAGDLPARGWTRDPQDGRAQPLGERQRERVGREMGTAQAEQGRTGGERGEGVRHGDSAKEGQRAKMLGA